MTDFEPLFQKLCAVCAEDDTKNGQLIQATLNECIDFLNNLPIIQVDQFGNKILNELASHMESDVCNTCFNRFHDQFQKHAKLIRFFHAMFPPNGDVETYLIMFNRIVENMDHPDSIGYCNALLAEFGLCAVADILMLCKHRNDTKLYQVVNRQLDTLWTFNVIQFNCEALEEEQFKQLAFGYLKEAFDEYGFHPKFLSEAPNVHLDQVVEHDINLLVETYDEDELVKKLQSYNEKQVDVAGAYHIMANIFHEGGLCTESYLWIRDQFESIGERCEREERYLAMCEASYRATGKRPRYINNTYDFGDEPDEKKKDPDWINPPHDEKEEKEEKLSLPDIPEPKGKKLSDDEEDKKPHASTIYNITYQNSFNRNRKRSINDSFNGSRINSDDISGDGSFSGGEKYGSLKSKKDVMAAWLDRSKVQKQIQKAFESKAAMKEPPEDIKVAYLKHILWDTENIKHVAPWIVMRDTQANRPSNEIQYRKYLAKLMSELADDRDLEYDGELVVAGDTIDGIYDIEVTRYNEKHVIEYLRKVANAVINREIKRLSTPKPNTGHKVINEALELFQQMALFDEAIRGGDPEKDRPIGERIYNRVETFNANSQQHAANLDKGLRQTAELGTSVMRTPNQLIRTVKNFISDMNNRKEQNLKEDILKDKTLRITMYDMMRSLIKTALPWVILGPIWGTLFNFISLPIRAIKGTITALRGGPHRDITIEIRNEMRTELDIVDDMIQKAEARGDVKEKHKLMRQKNSMEQEYLKIASKIHFDPRRESRISRSPTQQ